MAWPPRVTCKLAKYFIVLESRRQWTNIMDLLTKQTDPAPSLRGRDSSERKAKQKWSQEHLLGEELEPADSHSRIPKHILQCEGGIPKGNTGCRET